MISREEFVRRVWDRGEFELLTDPQSVVDSAAPGESYEDLSDLDALPKTGSPSPNKKTYIPYKKPGLGPTSPFPVQPDPQHAPDSSAGPSLSAYASVYDRVGAIIGGAGDRIAGSLADLGLAEWRPDAADPRGTPHPRLLSTLDETDGSFRPRPELWEVLEDG